MKHYRGCRLEDLTRVEVDGVPLPPREDLLRRNDAPAFEWGYQGSGPEHLAIAILAVHLGDDAQALEFARAFRDEAIAPLYGNEWEYTSRDIDRILHDIRNDKQKRKDLNSDHGIVHVDMTLEQLMNKVRGIK